MQNQPSNWFQNLLDKINHLAEQFGLDDIQTNSLRDFVVTTARDQFKIGSKSGARYVYKKTREEQTGSVVPQPLSN